MDGQRLTFASYPAEGYVEVKDSSRAGVSVVLNAHTFLPFHTPAVGASADRRGGAQHADTIDSYLTGKVARLVCLGGFADLRAADMVGGAQHADTIDSYLTGQVARSVGLADVADLRGHAVWLMKRYARQGLRRCCERQGKGNSDEPNHCHLQYGPRVRPSCRFQYTPYRALSLSAVLNAKAFAPCHTPAVAVA